jgi:hypothetical protein
MEVCGVAWRWLLVGDIEVHRSVILTGDEGAISASEEVETNGYAVGTG